MAAFSTKAFTWAAVIIAVIAAVLWFRSATVYAAPVPGGRQAQIITSGAGNPAIDWVATAQLQSWWNMWAAVASGAAAFCQGMAMFLHID